LEHHPAPGPGVLVVEDEAALRTMLQRGLELYGFTVWTAPGGREALALYQAHRDAIAVVLLDVQMPGLDGPHTLQAVKALNPDVPCCFMSGHTGEYTAEQLRELGAAHLFAKPFRLADVARVLRGLACGGLPAPHFAHARPPAPVNAPAPR
jgi:CheY-like chemotaxis protein